MPVHNLQLSPLLKTSAILHILAETVAASADSEAFCGLQELPTALNTIGKVLTARVSCSEHLENAARVCCQRPWCQRHRHLV